ncbi:MAG: MFS transporter [archaeon]|nr:MFS transporter [archaeon]
MNRNLKLVLAASVLIHSGVNLFAPLYAVFIENIGGTLFDAGAAIAIYSILSGVLYFLLKEIPDTGFSKRHMMFAGYIIFFFGYISYLFASSPLHVFGIQALLAIGEAIINPSWSAVIAASLEKGKERENYSKFYGYRSIISGLAALAGGFIANAFGFTIVFGAMAAFALVAAVIVLEVKE